MNNIQKPQKAKSFSLIWILPLIVLLFVGWNEYNTFVTQDNKITLIADDADGLKENITPLEYKGVKIGKIISIKINKDLKTTKITIQVNKKDMNLVAKKGNIFWIEKPRISINKISGLSTILTGYKIKLKPKLDSNTSKKTFKLLNNPPMNGYFITLKTKQNVDINTPIFYNGVKIGEIIKKRFDEQFFLTAIIYPEAKHFINDSSIFIKNPIIKIDSKGIDLKINSLSSALLGSISVTTPKKEKLTKKEFILYKDKAEVLPKKEINLIIKNDYGFTTSTPIIYQGIKIGGIEDIYLKDKKLIAKSYIYKKYQYLLSNNSMFLLQKPELSINGAKNLKNIIFGNYISISPKEGKLTKNTFKVYQNQINDSNSFKLTLYTDKLNSITLNSNIYYRNIPIGKVLNYSLTNDLKHIKITIAIQKKYKNLINNNSMFYDISSKLIALKNLNLNVNYEGINPLINGGIAVVTTPNKKLTKKSFKLYHSYQDIAEIKKLKHKGFVTNAYFSNDIKVSKNMNIEYKNQIIGFVRNIYFKTPDYSIAQLFIYEKYKPLITPHTIFYKKNPINIKANLNGINISIDNLTSLIKGSITLINTQQRYKKLQIAKNIDEINQKNSIKIVFSNGDGITTGSKLIYKGVKVGKVTKVELQNKKVIVYAILYNKNFTKKGTIFYLKKPIVSIDEVKNISSLILPVNIGIIKGNGKYTNYFVGYDKKPLQFNSDKGMIFKVYSTTASQNINAPVYYKNVKIGKIVNIDLTNKADKVLLYVFIQKKYTKLIRTNTKFYDISGLSIKFSFLKGTQIKANTLESIMRGGILVVTPINYSKKATTKDTFILYQKPPKDWQKISPKIP